MRWTRPLITIKKQLDKYYEREKDDFKRPFTSLSGAELVALSRVHYWLLSQGWL